MHAAWKQLICPLLLQEIISKKQNLLIFFSMEEYNKKNSPCGSWEGVQDIANESIWPWGQGHKLGRDSILSTYCGSYTPLIWFVLGRRYAFGEWNGIIDITFHEDILWLGAFCVSSAHTILQLQFPSQLQPIHSSSHLQNDSKLRYMVRQLCTSCS